MPISVEPTDDAAVVLAATGPYLRAEPVRHNLVATLLERWATEPGAGRCWIARDTGAVAGLAFRWPVHRPVVLTPMTVAVATAMADAVVDAGEHCAGVNGEVSGAATFAGRWTERTGGGARPAESLRLYAVDTVAPAAAPGGARLATTADAARLAGWLAAFAEEVGETLSTDPMGLVGQRIGAAELWVWEDDGPAAFLGCTQPTNGAVRIGPVYTPPDRRGRGYASALTAHCSAAARTAGDHCLLYADLANPTSNGIYRTLGYRAVAETLRYEFDPR
jgi:ribosomal protein S18 acetylase RimI-like enzyme